MQPLVGIVFVNCSSTDNFNAGLKVAPRRLNASSAPFQITVVNWTSSRDAHGVLVEAMRPGVRGSLDVTDSNWLTPRAQAAYVLDKSVQGSRVVFTRCRAVRPGLPALAVNWSDPLLPGFCPTACGKSCVDCPKLRVNGGVAFDDCHVIDSSDRPFLSLAAGVSDVSGSVTVRNPLGCRQSTKGHGAHVNVSVACVNDGKKDARIALKTDAQDSPPSLHSSATVVDSGLPALEASAAVPPGQDWVAAGTFCTCGVGTCCGCSDEGGPPYREMIMLAGNQSRVFALRGPTPFVVAERPSDELELGASAGPVVTAATISTGGLAGLDAPQREAVLLLSGRQQSRLTLVSIGSAACDRMTIVQLGSSTLLAPSTPGSEYVAMAVGGSFGGSSNVAVLLAADSAQSRQHIAVLGFSRGKFTMIREVPLLSPSEGSGRFVTIGPALPASSPRESGVFALWTPTHPQLGKSACVLRYDLTSAVSTPSPLRPVWNSSVDVLDGTQMSFLVGDVLGEQRLSHEPAQFLPVWVAQAGGGRPGLTLTAVPQPECVAAGFPTHQRVLSVGAEAGRRPWQAVTAAPWLAHSSGGELQLIGAVAPPVNASDFVVSLIVYGSARHFAMRAQQLEGARSHFGWPTSEGIAAMPGQLNRSHANTNFFLVGPTQSYTNLVDHLIDTAGFHVDGRQVIVILTLMPPPYANGRVPPDDPRTELNETRAFDKEPCWANAERGAACGQHYENYAAWGEVAGRLSLQFPHLSGLCLEEFGNSTASGVTHHASLWPQTVAGITSSMRRYSPAMSLIGGFYYTDTGCHWGDSCANAKPLCCGQTRLFTYRPDLALAIDTVVYWFRNDGFIGGANPCAAGGFVCDRLPPPYSQECVKNSSLCGCALGPLAEECAW